MSCTLGIRMHTQNNALSQYTVFPFNSMCMFNGVALAAGADGIYQIEGNLDKTAKISASFKTVTSDFGAPNQKRFRKVYLGCEANGELRLTVSNDEGNERSYILSPIQSGNLQHKNVVPIGRDGKGAYWNVKIENIDGADFSVDSIDALLVLLGNKPSGS